MKCQKEFGEFIDLEDFVFVLADKIFSDPKYIVTESEIVTNDEEFENICEGNGGDDDDVDDYVNDDAISDFVDDDDWMGRFLFWAVLLSLAVVYPDLKDRFSSSFPWTPASYTDSCFYTIIVCNASLPIFYINAHILMYFII